MRSWCVIGSGHLEIEVTFCGGIGLGQVNECI